MELKAWSPPKTSRARIRTKSMDAMMALSGSGTESTTTNFVNHVGKGRPLQIVSKDSQKCMLIVITHPEQTTTPGERQLQSH